MKKHKGAYAKGLGLMRKNDFFLRIFDNCLTKYLMHKSFFMELAILGLLKWNKGLELASNKTNSKVIFY